VLDLKGYAAARPAQARTLGVWLLGFGETIVWACIYYIFAALLLTWEQTIGFAKAELTLGFTVAILCAAVASPLNGRLIDRGYGRWTLGLGCLGGAAALALLATVSEPWQFVAVWALIGFAQGVSLYEPCFSVVTRALGAEARPAITRITLLAGLASTVCFLASAALLEALDWRETLLVFAFAAAVLAAPMLYLGAALLEGAAPETSAPAAPEANRAALHAAFRRPVFWILALAFPMMALNHGILINHIMPILADRGIGRDTAILVASTVGPMQVAGRIVLMLTERWVDTMAATAGAFFVVMLASLVLWSAQDSAPLVFLFAAMQGGAYGLTSILKPAITAALLGRVGFGAISGWLAFPYLIGGAFAPHLGAIVWGIGGYSLVILATAALAAGGALSMGGLALGARLRRPK